MYFKMYYTFILYKIFLKINLNIIKKAKNHEKKTYNKMKINTALSQKSNTRKTIPSTHGWDDNNENIQLEKIQQNKRKRI